MNSESQSEMSFAVALARIARCAETGALGADGGWFTDGIQSYLGGEPFDHAMRAAWASACRRRRDQALREYARLYPAGISAWAAALQIATELRRYESSAWLRDRNGVGMPPGYLGTPYEFLFTACRANADAGERGMPRSARQLARILNPMDRQSDLRRDPPLPMSKRVTAECIEQETEDVAEKAIAPFERRRKGGRN
jgi:hypothetical protein